MASITEDSIVEIRVKGPENPNDEPRNYVRTGGTISYRLYDANYPLMAGLPADTCT